MLAQIISHPVYAQVSATAGEWGDWHRGGGAPGWWLVVPIGFWVVVLSVGAYLIYRGSSGPSARRAAERTLAERYARGEISEDELRQRRAGLRGRS